MCKLTARVAVKYEKWNHRISLMIGEYIWHTKPNDVGFSELLHSLSTQYMVCFMKYIMIYHESYCGTILQFGRRYRCTIIESRFTTSFYTHQFYDIPKTPTMILKNNECVVHYYRNWYVWRLYGSGSYFKEKDKSDVFIIMQKDNEIEFQKMICTKYLFHCSWAS